MDCHDIGGRSCNYPGVFRLAERGHEVVGVEYAKAAVTKFFEHNKLPFSVQQCGKLNVYKVGEDSNNHCQLIIYLVSL